MDCSHKLDMYNVNTHERSSVTGFVTSTVFSPARERYHSLRTVNMITSLEIGHPNSCLLNPCFGVLVVMLNIHGKGFLTLCERSLIVAFKWGPEKGLLKHPVRIVLRAHLRNRFPTSTELNKLSMGNGVEQDKFSGMNLR